LLERSIDRGGIEWRLPAHHRHYDFCVIVVLFHQIFARRHGVGLGHGGAGAESDHQDGQDCADEHPVQLSVVQMIVSWRTLVRRSYSLQPPKAGANEANLVAAITKS
jgi:hypothetical protein